MIPKIIHFCWFGGAEKPPMATKCIDSWTRILPGWDIREWSEENSPVLVPYVARALSTKRYAFASDYVRFFALYNEGGVYLDTDMELIRDITPLLESEMFLGKESASHINASIVGAERRHPMIGAIIDELNERNGIAFDAIPEIVTSTFTKHKELTSAVKVYDPEYFYPYNPFDQDRNLVRQLFYSDITDNTFAIHHWAQSWNYTLTERMFRRMKRLLGMAN